MSVPKIRVAAIPAGETATPPLASRVRRTADNPEADAAFQSLLNSASIFAAHGQNVESREVLKTALDIAVRRWWLAAENRPESHFLDTARLLIRMRACDAISKLEYGRVKQILKRNEGISTRMLSDLRGIAIRVHDKAIEPGRAASEREVQPC